LHLAATAARSTSVDLSEGLGPLIDAVSRGGWIRGVGVNPPDLPDRAALDAVRPDVAVRVQDRSGSVWVLNSRALQLLGPVDGVDTADGRLWRLDALLQERLPPAEVDVGGLARDLLAMGLTHLTDATPDLSPEAATGLRDAVPQHLLLLGGSDGPGPRKIVLPDHAAPDFAALCASLASVHDHGRPVAIHCVTAASLALIIAAFHEVGVRAGDRIEHAAMVPFEALSEVARLGVAVVTQPTIVATRGHSFVRESDQIDIPDLWRHRSLLAAGIPTFCSSDAPYGDPDPWRTLRSAASRDVGPDERVAPEVAVLSLFADPIDLGRQRVVKVGQPADLLLLTLPLADALRAPDRGHIASVILRGQVQPAV
jgi:predicted amidohydrolase YtcJ